MPCGYRGRKAEKPRYGLKEASVPGMAPSRTIGEQTAADWSAGRIADGEERWIFQATSDVSSDDVSADRSQARPARPSTRARSTSSPTTSRDALLTEFGKDTLRDRYLLPGETYQDLFARVASAYADDAGPRPARLRLYLQAVVHAGDPGAVERRHRPRPADQLLSEQRRRQPRRHRRHLERECLAGRRKGGGIGTYWGSVRGIGEPVGLNGKTSGIIPFVRVMD